MPTHPYHNAQARRRFAQRSAKSRGVVIVIALLGTMLIAALIGYVFNTGRHAQLRMETQNAADATAISGAGYIARSFNVVAMNNTEITRLIATVQHLDALPLAVEYTLADELMHLEAVQRINGGPVADRATLGPALLAEIQEQYRDIEILREMDDFFQARPNDIQDFTFYAGPNGRGELWRAMEALDALSEATMENLSQLSQIAATEAGHRNMARGADGLAAIVPYQPQFPWERYSFDDFERPVTRGMLPEWIDDPIENRGPYDAVFGWRHLDVDNEYATIGGGQSQVDNSGSFQSGWSRRSSNNSGARSVLISSTVTGYRTYGPWNWLARQFLAMNQELQDTALFTRWSGMSLVKLNYLWPGQRRGNVFVGIPEPENIEHAIAPSVFLDPEWIISYPEAEAIRDAGTPRIVYARYLAFEMEQTFIDGVPTSPNPILKRSEVVNTFRRREFFSPPGLNEADRVGSYYWKDEISSPLKYVDGDGREFEVYTTFYFFWLGVNVGPMIQLRDPNNFENRADLPAPIDFIHGQIDRPRNGELGRPGDPFSILAITAQPNRANMWPDLFNRSAHDDVTSVAQAAVFNNHSWDLWTQMWYAQLEPVQDFGEWVDYARSIRADADVYPDIDTQRLDQTLQYFDALRPLADPMMNH